MNHIYSNLLSMAGWLVLLLTENFVFLKKNKHWHKGLVHPSYSLKGKKVRCLKIIQSFMSKDISELLARFNRNSSLHAIELKKQIKI